jgi:hypothetical protein
MVESTLSFKRNFKIFDQTSKKDMTVYSAPNAAGTTPGAHTFTMEYSSTSGTPQFGSNYWEIQHPQLPTDASRPPRSGA